MVRYRYSGSTRSEASPTYCLSNSRLDVWRWSAMHPSLMALSPRNVQHARAGAAVARPQGAQMSAQWQHARQSVRKTCTWPAAGLLLSRGGVCADRRANGSCLPHSATHQSSLCCPQHVVASVRGGCLRGLARVRPLGEFHPH